MCNYPPNAPDTRTFEQKLEDLLNYHSMENDSHTPDFILASYMTDCLTAWNKHTRDRDKWYGVNLEPGNSHFDAKYDSDYTIRVVPRG